MGKFVEMPALLALDSILQTDEVVASTNAIVVTKKTGEFSFWVDKKGYITVYVEDEEDKNRSYKL